MIANRHFHLITITWAPASSLLDAGANALVRSTGGPGGSVIDALARTKDGIYDLRVSTAMLLPDSVQIPDFDPIQANKRLIEAYSRLCPDTEDIAI